MNDHLKKLQQQENLTLQEMRVLMLSMMAGELTDAFIVSVLDALQKKGETIEEITAAAMVMRELAIPVNVADPKAIDIVGTGYDHPQIVNISTATAIVVAACGVSVAKQINRAFFSKVGSADVLEAAGANLALSPMHVEKMIADIQLGFLLTPLYHPALRHVASARKAFGQRSLFDLLEPLSNPAQVKHYLLGVCASKWLLPFAKSLRNLGCVHGFVVYSHDELDKLSIAAPTEYVEIHCGLTSENAWSPEQLDLWREPLNTLRIETAEQSLALINSAFADKPNVTREMIILNTGAALRAADKVETIKEGIALAREVIAQGKAAEKLRQFVEYTQKISVLD